MAPPRAQPSPGAPLVRQGARGRGSLNSARRSIIFAARHAAGPAALASVELSERPWDGCWDKTATARATDKARKASRRRDGVTGVTADGVTAEMQSRGYLSPKRSAAGLQLLSGHQGVCARCCALLPPSPPWHQLPLERGAAHEPDEPCLSPSNGDKDRPRGLAIGHNFRPPAPAIGQKMLLAQDRAQAQRPACDPTGQTTS